MAKFLITDIYHLTPEKQNMALVLLMLTVATCTERVCLCCWTEFLAGVPVYSPSYCLCVDMSARKSLEAGRQFHSIRRRSQHIAGFQFAAPQGLLPLLALCRQICAAGRSSSHLLTSSVTAAQVVRMNKSLPLVMVRSQWICPRPGTHRSGKHFTSK